MSERTKQLNPPKAPSAAKQARAHIVVYGNPHKPGIGPILRALSDWAAAGGHRISVEADIAEMALEHDGMDADACKIFEGDHPGETLDPASGNPTLLLTLGGDGTMLHAIHRFWPLKVPVFGVSLGTLSFNAAVMPGHLVGALEEWLRGEIDVSERMVLRVVQMRGEKVFAEGFAVNDAVLGKQENLRMIHISLKQGRETVSAFAGDGLIVSTPTGSTAYNLSAGGPIVFPTMRVLVATAICPHTLAARAVVLNPSPPLVIEYVPRHSGGLATLAIDGQIQWTLQADDKVLVEASEHSLKMVNNNNPRYFERLRQKLSWGNDFSV